MSERRLLKCCLSLSVSSQKVSFERLKTKKGKVGFLVDDEFIYKACIGVQMSGNLVRSRNQGERNNLINIISSMF